MRQPDDRDDMPIECCSHLNVVWATKPLPKGETTGGWHCKMCGTTFAPIQNESPVPTENPITIPCGPMAYDIKPALLDLMLEIQPQASRVPLNIIGAFQRGWEAAIKNGGIG